MFPGISSLLLVVAGITAGSELLVAAAPSDYGCHVEGMATRAIKHKRKWGLEIETSSFKVYNLMLASAQEYNRINL